MKERTPEQLKGRIRDFAQNRNLQSQEVLQMFLFERVLERLSMSPYKINFILKGGLLISSIIGIAERTTMDIDTTVKGIKMEEEEIKRIISEILSIDVGDEIEFVFVKLEPIRENDDYNNFRAYFIANYGKISNMMKMDITTGDEITPEAVQYSYRTILDNDEINILSYNLERIIAEKFETIIRRNIGTSRMRDFYDLYMIVNMYKEQINTDVLKLAIVKTAQKRNSLDFMQEWKEIMEEMETDYGLEKMWRKYCAHNSYAAKVSYQDVISAVSYIASIIFF